MTRGGLVFALALALGSSALAVAPQAAPIPDPRIRTVLYDPDQVVRLNAAFGYQLMLQFGPDERIENVSIGDGSAWQVTPNKKATLLFIKPVESAARTNMTVVTDHHAYLFDLNVHAETGPTPYHVRFSSPVPRTPAASTTARAPFAPERRNVAYSYTGSRAALPAIVFDDGRFTYFKWPDSSSTPALFLVAADGSESIVNYSVRDGYQVVEQVAPRFVLRNGRDVTYVINDAWRDPKPGAGAPQPHDAKTARAAARAEGVR